MELREQSRGVLIILCMCSAYLFTSWVTPNISEEHVVNATRHNEKERTFELAKYENLPESSSEDAARINVINETKSPEISGSQNANKKARKGVQSCLQRFICEIHAQPPGFVAENKLEESILNTFSSGYMEGPESPIYPYQLAAHVGQLSSGCQPSTCQSLYSSCPYSSRQFIGIVTRLKPLKGRLL